MYLAHVLIMPMKIQQTYVFCIAHAACYLESNAEVAIFDSPREVTHYIKIAEKDGVTM